MRPSVCNTVSRSLRGRGLARTSVNLFLRDTFYNHYCNYRRHHYHVARAEPFFEMPLDGVVANALREALPDWPLPPWPGGKCLDRPTGELYQGAASALSRQRRIARLHLDTCL